MLITLHWPSNRAVAVLSVMCVSTEESIVLLLYPELNKTPKDEANEPADISKVWQSYVSSRVFSRQRDQYDQSVTSSLSTPPDNSWTLCLWTLYKLCFSTGFLALGKVTAVEIGLKYSSVMPSSSCEASLWTFINDRLDYQGPKTNPGRTKSWFEDTFFNYIIRASFQCWTSLHKTWFSLECSFWVELLLIYCLTFLKHSTCLS